MGDNSDEFPNDSSESVDSDGDGVETTQMHSQVIHTNHLTQMVTVLVTMLTNSLTMQLKQPTLTEMELETTQMHSQTMLTNLEIQMETA